MKFLSIREYFYKLNTIGFILLLPPMAVFIFLYYWLGSNTPVMAFSQSSSMLMQIAIGASMVGLTGVHWTLHLKLIRLRRHIELARKMDGYYSMTILRMAGYCSCSLLMAAGFFLTGELWFTGLFILITFGIVLQWPSRLRFCRLFDLRGGERDMIMNNRPPTKRSSKSSKI